MKLVAFFLLISISFIGNTQTKPITVTSEKQDKLLVIQATNNTALTQEVTITLTKRKGLRGYTRPLTQLVRPGETLTFYELTILEAYSWASKYSSKPKATAQEQKAFDKERKAYLLNSLEGVDITQGIVVFDKTGCPRCHRTTSYFMDNNVDFKLLNVTENKEYHELMWTLLRENKAVKGEITMPVIMVDGKLSHSHEDLIGFLKLLPD